MVGEFGKDFLPMHVIFHHQKYYDWVPVPSDVKVLQAHIAKKLVKPGGPTGWLMRIEQESPADDPTHSVTNTPESEIIALIVEDKVRYKTKRTRVEAVCHYIARHAMWHNAHESWLHAVEVHDDGPQEKEFVARVQQQVDAGNIDELDVPGMLALYKTPGDLRAALESHFGIKTGWIRPTKTPLAVLEEGVH